MKLEKILNKIEDSFSIVYVIAAGLVIFLLWANYFDIDALASSDPSYTGLYVDTIVHLDANDTAVIQVRQQGGASQADINTIVLDAHIYRYASLCTLYALCQF